MKLLIFICVAVALIQSSMQIDFENLDDVIRDIEQVPEPNGKILGTFGKRELKEGDDAPIGSGVDVDPESPVDGKDHKKRSLVDAHHDLGGENHDQEGELPALIKTLRLRPGSDEYNRVVEKFINDRKEKEGQREKRSPGNKLPPPPKGGELPALIKTLRLRPGSDEYNRVVERFINDRKEDEGKQNLEKKHGNKGEDNKPAENGSNGNGDVLDYLKKVGSEKIIGGKKPIDGRPKRSIDDKDDDDKPKLPGENMIGKNRHPSGRDKKKPIIEDESNNRDKRSSGNKLPPPPPEHNEGELPALLKTLRLRPGSDEYNRVIENFVNERNEQQQLGGEDEKETLKDHPEISDKENDLIHGWIEKYINDKKNRHGGNLDNNKNDDGHNIENGREKRSDHGQDENAELPVLLKTLRLRPGSEEYNRVVEKFINDKKEKEGQREKRSPGNKLPPPPPEDGELPALLKTLRLRPGSDEYNRVVEKFINDRKEQQQHGDDKNE